MLIQSPFVYTGNKARYLEDLLKLFPEDITHFADLFCGGGVVGINATAESILLNDKLTQVIDFYEYLKNTSYEEVLNGIDKYIFDYKLGTEHSLFLKMREDYNNSPNPLMFYVLSQYSFGYSFRFNSKGKYNMPEGNRKIVDKGKIETFQKALARVQLSNKDFTEVEVNDFAYLDPPYYITDAAYNRQWSLENEYSLYEYCDLLNSNGKRFALSNVLIYKGKENTRLKGWAENYNVNFLHTTYHFKSGLQDKCQDVLVTNY